MYNSVEWRGEAGFTGTGRGGGAFSEGGFVKTEQDLGNGQNRSIFFKRLLTLREEVIEREREIEERKGKVREARGFKVTIQSESIH